MNFSTWSIHRPIPAILLFVLLTAAGLIGFRMLPIAEMPDFDFPGIIVSVSLPGATPTQLETEVTRKIEAATAAISGAKHVTSTVTDGDSETFIEFQMEKDVQEALDDVRDAVTSVRSSLPPDVLEPRISRVTVNGGSIATYTVSSNSMDPADLSWFVDNTVSRSILPLKGVGRVVRYGGIAREVRVELDPVKLQAMNVTAGDVSQQLQNMQQEAPGGRGDFGGLEQAVRTIGTVGSADDLRAFTVPLADGRRLRLDQVASVHDTSAEQRQLSLLDGKPVLSFRVYRTRGSAEVDVAKAVEKAVEQMAKDHPRVQFEQVYTTVGHIERAYKGSMEALLEGAILAVVVVWLFLRDWRATIVSAVALPLSIIPTFAFMHWAGYTLNGITLLAMTLVIGILVDDAIVEVENIIRHLGFAKTPKVAAEEAANEIGLAVIATSLTIVAVFVPVALMSGIAGLVFRQFGWTTAVAVLTSLAVARLITPMMSAYMLKARPHEPQADGWIMRRYLIAVRACLRHPWRTSFATAAFFVASIALVSLLPTAFISAGDRALVEIDLEAPPGSKLDVTRDMTLQATALLHQLAEVKKVYAIIGNGQTAGSASSSDGDVTKATLLVPLTDTEDRKRSQQDVEADMRRLLAALPGARVSVGGQGSGAQLTVVLTGDDAQMLQSTATSVAHEIRSKLHGLGGVISSASLLRPELVIRPDFARAAELGVNASAIGDAVRIATSGDYDVVLPKLNLPERQLYIRTMLAPAARQDLDTIRQLRVRSSNGGTVPLASVAQFAIEGGPAQIDRYDRSRNVTLSVELQGRALGDVDKEIAALPTMQHLPGNVKRATGGDLEFMQDMFTNFLLAMATGIFCVYAVMVLLFHDFWQPFTVLAALPLAAGGALGALVLCSMDLSLASLIGLLMLIGIVSKNSILLVEYAITARSTLGLSRLDAIVDACHKRARPIVMTTVAMVAGMLPMALNLSGGDSGFRSPMAVAVIGGLLTSTVLSLVVVPVVFELVDEARFRVRRRFGYRPALDAEAVPEVG
ncbi:MAG: acriflavine resistance protein [Hydrocarboniphaga sp.]|uniref:efflux RND transporter permease subunit n=1 Tax=Hydrocarboniphaga sp. TaxID=2033016 RepID=UPI0026366039|nr:efflux RND transporter permease subunit [Hydrocarboniphaga sp.]MDB5969142.1 acriflavine resistance protein [Hydrocarboniphaga sp.]